MGDKNQGENVQKSGESGVDVWNNNLGDKKSTREKARGCGGEYVIVHMRTYERDKVTKCDPLGRKTQIGMLRWFGHVEKSDEKYVS